MTCAEPPGLTTTSVGLADLVSWMAGLTMRTAALSDAFTGGLRPAKGFPVTGLTGTPLTVAVSTTSSSGLLEQVKCHVSPTSRMSSLLPGPSGPRSCGAQAGGEGGTVVSSSATFCSGVFPMLVTS